MVDRVAHIAKRNPEEMGRLPFLEWCSVAHAALGMQKDDIAARKKAEAKAKQRRK